MKLNELLSIEKNQQTQFTTLIQDTLNKFGKEHFFRRMG